MSPVVVSPAPNDSLEALSTADFDFVEGILPRAFYRRSSAAGMRTRSGITDLSADMDGQFKEGIDDQLRPRSNF
jgi:hypothetical protein